MRLLKFISLSFLAFLLTMKSAYANPLLPQWVSTPPADDNHYRYYVGKSNLETDLQRADEEATTNARQTAIEENFGVEIRMQSQTLDSLEQNKLLKKVQQRTRSVRLIGFERISYWTEQGDGPIHAYVLYRYSRGAIEQEKARLEKIKEEPLSGDALALSASSTLKVNSLPSGAEIIIDGKTMGRTSTETQDIDLPPGYHRVEITLDGYLPFINQIYLYPLSLRHIIAVLDEIKPKEGKVTETANPDISTYEQIVPSDLKSIDEPLNDDDRKSKLSSPWLFGLGITFGSHGYSKIPNTTMYGLNLFLEKKFANIFGIRVAWQGSTGADGPLLRSTTGWSVALPFYFYTRQRGDAELSIYLMPEYGMRRLRFDLKPLGTGKQEVSQSIYSLSLGCHGYVIGKPWGLGIEGGVIKVNPDNLSFQGTFILLLHF